ncbi:MAG: hypothetical protein ACK55W_17065, partial [Pseudomonadota bacterium]
MTTSRTVFGGNVSAVALQARDPRCRPVAPIPDSARFVARCAGVAPTEIRPPAPGGSLLAALTPGACSLTPTGAARVPCWPRRTASGAGAVACSEAPHELNARLEAQDGALLAELEALRAAVPPV